MPSPLLSIEGLKVYYATERGLVKAIDGVSLELDRGETLALVGESGCGKSTLGLTIIRNLSSNVALLEGSIAFEGEELLAMPEEEFRKRIRWRRIAMAFQGAMNSLNPVMKVGEQITEPLRVLEGLEKAEARREGIRALKEVGLGEEVYDRYPHELSGGMKQRVVIAMALIMNPSLIILDEPTSALDVSVQAQVINLLKRLWREHQLSMIFITHDIAVASDLCAKMAVLYAGEVVEVAPADRLLTDPLHPYARALLESAPRLRGEGRPKAIPGSPPSLLDPPSGCRFHPRCPFAFERCPRERPPLLTKEDKRSVACWLHDEPSP